MHQVAYNVKDLNTALKTQRNGSSILGNDTRT